MSIEYGLPQTLATFALTACRVANPSIAVAAAAKFLAVVFPFLATRALH